MSDTPSSVEKVTDKDWLDGVVYERDLYAEIIRDPAKLLSHLLDTKGVEPGKHYVWGRDELPACICIPADLSARVFGGSADDHFI